MRRDEARPKSLGTPRSDGSSSDAAPQTADEDPATEDEAGVTLRAVSLLQGDLSDGSETTDAEEAWVNPMYWDLGLARHTSWFTVHAVVTRNLLLCGRAMDSNYESVVNPPDSHPVCRVCRARVRGRVEQARRLDLPGAETSGEEKSGTPKEDEDYLTQQSEPATQSSESDCDA